MASSKVNMTPDEYLEFMNNKKNVCQCEGCPENIGIKDPNHWHMCGQQHCWVYIHCKPRK